MSTTDLDVSTLLQSHLQRTHGLIKRCSELQQIQGVKKLHKKLLAELKFLEKLSSQNTSICDSHLRSSNLGHLEGIIHTANTKPEVVGVLQPFCVDSSTRENLIVDVVCFGGYKWVKVIARKAQALHLIWAGQGQFGTKSVLTQAKQYLQCAQHNQWNYHTPKIVFIFCNGVTKDMAAALRETSIEVEGEEEDVEEDVVAKLQALKDVEDESDTDGTSSNFCGNDDNEDAHFVNTDTEINGPADKVTSIDEMPRQKYDLNDTDVQYKNDGLSFKINDADHEDRNKMQVNNPDFDTASVFDTTATEYTTSEINQDVVYDNTKVKVTTCKSTYPATQTKQCKIINYEFSDPDETFIMCTIGANQKDRSDDLLKVKMHKAFLNLFDYLPLQMLGYHGKMSSGCHDTGKRWKDHYDDASLDHHSDTVPPLSSSTLPDEAADVISSVHEKSPLEKPPSASAPMINKVNFDITTLIAMVTSLTHGGSGYIFQEAILSQQAAEESEQAVLPELCEYLKGKQLFVCETAYHDFQTILATVGGATEHIRARLLLDKVKVIPDAPSLRAQNLVTSGKIKERAKVIFGTSDTIQAVTVSANVGFVRAAQNQGVHFPVHIHQPRALTEAKEGAAQPLSKTT